MNTTEYIVLTLTPSPAQTYPRSPPSSKPQNFQLAINRFLTTDCTNASAQQDYELQAVMANLDDPNVIIYKVVDNETGAMVAHLVLTRLGKKEERGKKVSITVMQAIQYINEEVQVINRIGTSLTNSF